MHRSTLASITLRQRQHGLSIIELMIAITIGLIILTGLSLMFVNSSTNTRELVKTAQQLENGRYAIETIRQDLMLAGFYGQFSSLPTAPTVAPDPCSAMVDKSSVAPGPSNATVDKSSVALGPCSAMVDRSSTSVEDHLAALRVPSVDASFS